MEQHRSSRLSPSHQPFNLAITFLLSLFALILVHSIYLQKAPGFQMDEGLFADTAIRIVNGESIPILEGMVSYTTWICSYVPALLFKFFGINQVVYRVSGVLEVVLGVLMMSGALYLLNEKKTAAILPGVIAFFPALVINQRWVVEANTFFALCAGMVALGLSIKVTQNSKKIGRSILGSFLIVLGITAGIHSHIVFIAPVLSLYLCLLAAGKLRKFEDRAIVICIGLLQLPFFFKIKNSEPGAQLQYLALIGADIAVVLASLFPKFLDIFSVSTRQKLLLIPAVCGFILLVPFFIFIEGHWLAMFSVGFLDYPFLIGLGVIPVGITVHHLLKSGWRPRSIPVLLFLPLSIFFVYGMVIKAGPRYFEVMFLYVAVCLTWAMTRLSGKKAIVVGALWVLQGSLILGLNYFKPSVEERQINTVFHLWRWRDGSGGFMPKVRLLKRLAAEGCGYENIDFRIRDDNTHGAMRLLKVNDWPPFQPPCRLGERVRIESRTDFSEPEDPKKRRFIEGPYWLVDTTHE